MPSFIPSRKVLAEKWQFLAPKLIIYACISLIMHDPDTKLLSSHRLIITMVHAKYLSQRVYGFGEKVEHPDEQTDRQT